MDKIKRNMTSRASMGFSLMELIIVILLIGIFASVAMTKTRTGLSTIREQIAIDQITSDIDLVRSMAFGKHDTMTIVFSASNESYAILNGPDGSRSLVEDYPNSDDGTISLDNSTMRDVNLQSVNFDGESFLQFLPLGDVRSGGSLAINNKTITIQPITGKWSVN
jgi:prepilin-type N-terminal cleavage/methylation domain-containing protein